MFAAATVAYFARPWSCSSTLAQFSPDADVPYSHFDYHGMGVLVAWLLAIGFAVPVLGLAARIFLEPTVRIQLFAKATDRSTTRWSIGIAVALAFPMHAQVSYLLGLPVHLTMPIIWSSIAWAGIVELARSAAVSGERAGRLDKIGKPATGIAGLILIPKLILLAILIGR